jgi:hypothetical protein
MPAGPRSKGAGAVIAAAIAVSVAGCGGAVGGGGAAGGGSAAGGGGAAGGGRARAKPVAFKRVASPETVPAGWGRLRVPSGAVLPYPAGWRRLDGDPGSATAALLNADGTIRDYLNVTPADRDETVGGWARFRLRHNRSEGDRDVRLITTETAAVLGHRRRACVIDDYATTRSRYRELACVVVPADGRRATVLVAAAQPKAWAREQPAFDLAFNHFAG